jgi:hypothetical protein
VRAFVEQVQVAFGGGEGVELEEPVFDPHRVVFGEQEVEFEEFGEQLFGLLEGLVEDDGDCEIGQRFDAFLAGLLEGLAFEGQGEVVREIEFRGDFPRVCEVVFPCDSAGELEAAPAQFVRS